MSRSIRRLLPSVAFLILFLSSCSEDDSGPAGSFNVDGEKKRLVKGYVDIGDFQTDADSWNVFLTSGSLDYNTDDVTGIGDAISFTLIDPANTGSTEIAEGTYVLGGSGFKLQGAVAYVEYNFENGQGDFYAYMQNGAVIVTRTGSTYTFDFSFTMEPGVVIIGTYTGSLMPKEW